MTKQIYKGKKTLANANVILPCNPHQSCECSPSLDTLAQLTPKGATLQKRARSKFITNALVSQLVKLDSELKKSYYRTLDCGGTIRQKDGKLTSNYCNQRWCLTCNRIRTAKAINGYGDQLKSLKNIYFVTLTAPNVEADKLRSEVNTFQERFRAILKALNKRGIKVKGLRKLEVTHGRNGFNPHYHLVVKGAHEAEELLREWLKRTPGVSEGGQNIKRADEGSIVELLKYSVKITAKSANISALNEIFLALRGKRTIQPIGGLKRVSEDVTDLDAVINTEDQNEDIFVWSGHDWYSINDGAPLSEYWPDDEALDLVSAFMKTKPPE
jgi:hypothetical protein